jgi:integrase
MRRLASRVLAKARLGQDTVAEKRAAIGDGKTLGDLIPAYLQDRNSELRPTSYGEIKRHLEQHWKPLHSMRVRLIDRQNVVRILDDLAEDNGKGAADRARSALSTLFAWAIDRNFMQANPTIGIRPRLGNASRSRVLSELELIEVWRACEADDFGRIVKLLILTLQRRTEISDLSVAEIDLSQHQILLAEYRTKNGRPHVVPLSELAWEVLESAPRRENRELLFGRGEGGYSGWTKSKSELDDRVAKARQRAGIEKQMPAWTLHDLRRSGSTHLHEKGFAQPHVVEAILNHISGHQAGVAGVYNKALYLAERRAALGLWGEHMRSLVEGKSSNVVSLKTAYHG